MPKAYWGVAAKSSDVSFVDTQCGEWKEETKIEGRRTSVNVEEVSISRFHPASTKEATSTYMADPLTSD